MKKNEFGRSFTLCELWSSTYTEIPFLVWQRVEKIIAIESYRYYKIIRNKKSVLLGDENEQKCWYLINFDSILIEIIVTVIKRAQIY